MSAPPRSCYFQESSPGVAELADAADSKARVPNAQICPPILKEIAQFQDVLTVGQYCSPLLIAWLQISRITSFEASRLFVAQWRSEGSYNAPMSDSPAEHMKCLEVCGGSQLTAQGVVIGGLDAWVYSKPHGQAKRGGDVYYASSCAAGRITRLLLADVSGHGKSVAAIAADLRLLMRRFINRWDQAEFVRLLNQQFSTLSKTGTFATAIVSTFFAPSRRLILCNAGHPRPILYRACKKNGTCWVIEAPLPCLGRRICRSEFLASRTTSISTLNLSGAIAC